MRRFLRLRAGSTKGLSCKPFPEVGGWALKTTKGTWEEPHRTLKSQGKYLPCTQRSAHRRFTPPRDALEQHLSGREGGRMGLVQKLSFQAAAAETSADPPGSSEDCPESG